MSSSIPITIHVLIPYLNINLEIEINDQSTFRDLKTLIQDTVREDTPLEIYRFKR